MESPIFVYLENIPDTLINIAPEKKSEILDIVRKSNIQFIADDRKDFIFKTNTVKKEIRFSVPALEHLWASAYAYWIVYQEAYAANQNGIKRIDIKENPKLKKATDLLLWSWQNISGDKYTSWPLDLPKPVKPTVNKSDEHVATEFFLCAAAWILHHEISHIVSNHSNMSESASAINEEKEADKRATSWIVSDISDQQIIQKRMFGVAIANLVLVSFGIEKKDFSSTTHPKSYCRLFDNLEHANLDPNHLVYFFVIVSMKLHMDHSGIDIDNNAYDTAKECFQEYCLKLSRI